MLKLDVNIPQRIKLEGLTLIPGCFKHVKLGSRAKGFFRRYTVCGATKCCCHNQPATQHWLGMYANTMLCTRHAWELMIRVSMLYPLLWARLHEAWAQGRVRLGNIRTDQALDFSGQPQQARVSRTGVRTGLQLQGHRDMQGFNSSSLAVMANVEASYHPMGGNAVSH